MGSRRTFLSLAAQQDNLGDIAIRQVVVDLVTTSGSDLVAYVGSMPQEYVDAFDLPASVELCRSGRSFAGKLGWSAATSAPNLVFAPGPYVVRDRPAAWLKAALLLVLVSVLRARGGQVVVLGRALRGEGRMSARVQRGIARRSSMYVARDLLSGPVIAADIAAAPDLALAVVAPAASAGDVVISLRGDKPVVPSEVSTIIEGIRGAGLRPVFVTQVQRDDTQHRSLAEGLGVDLVGWSNETHREQLARVNEAFSGAAAVVSNRLHAVIFGLQRGAVPVALVRDTDRDKVVNTLRHLVPLQVLDLSQGEVERQMHGLSLDRSRALGAALDQVRRDLHVTLDQALALLSGADHDHRTTEGDPA